MGTIKRLTRLPKHKNYHIGFSIFAWIASNIIEREGGENVLCVYKGGIRVSLRDP